MRNIKRISERGTSNLQLWLEEECAKLRIAGAALCLLLGDETSFAFAGFIDDKHRPDIDSNSLFPLACVAKTLTTILILRLCAASRLELHTPIIEILDLPTGVSISGETKVGHLLSHTSGIVSSAEFRLLADRALFGGDVGFLRTLRQQYRPGQVFSYTHSPFVIAGEIVRRLTGRSWEDNVCTMLNCELGGRFARGARRGPLGYPDYSSIRAPRAPDIFNSALGSSTFVDIGTLAKFGRCLLKENEISSVTRVLSDTWLDELRHSEWLPRYGDTPFSGLGIRTLSNGCFGHRGSANGCDTLLLVRPESSLVLALVVKGDAGILAERAARGIADTSWATNWPTGAHSSTLDPSAYIARYSAYGQVIDITCDSGQLCFTAHVDPSLERARSIRLIPVSNEIFVGACPFRTPFGHKKGVYVEFIKGLDQGFQWLRVNELAYQKTR